MEINHQDLKYFTGCALQGLCANPMFTGVNGQKYLQMKNRTLESLAVESALEVLECLEKVTEALDKEEAKVSAENVSSIITGAKDGTNP